MALIPARPTPCSTAGIAAITPGCRLRCRRPVGGQRPASPCTAGTTAGSPLLCRPHPKSTGREMFTLDWLDGELAGHAHAPADVQRTLQALTTASPASCPHWRMRRAGPSCMSAAAAPITPRCWRSWPACCPAGASPTRPSWGSPRLDGRRGVCLAGAALYSPPARQPAGRHRRQPPAVLGASIPPEPGLVQTNKAGPSLTALRFHFPPDFLPVQRCQPSCEGHDAIGGSLPPAGWWRPACRADCLPAGCHRSADCDPGTPPPRCRC